MHTNNKLKRWATSSFATLLTIVWALPAALADPPPGAETGRAPEAADCPADGIEWHDDLDGAMALAREDGRPVIAYFTYDTCSWCHKLERDTYSDPSVIAFSRKFIWVKVNRDVTPETCKYFNISAYPSLITIGHAREKVYRFSGYKLPDLFLPELEESLRRFDLYRKGEEWDFPPPRADTILSNAPVELIAAPSEKVPAGLAFMGDRMFIAQIGALYELDPETGAAARSFPINPSVLDITTDGEFIYAMTGGWTAGQPIYVIDPRTGDVVREIITEANKTNRSHGAKGITFADGNLFVLEGMRGGLRRIDRDTGEVLATVQTDQTWITGLAWDGEHFITGSRDKLLWIDPKTGRTVKSIPVNYPLRSVGFHEGSVYLMEQPVFGYNTAHERIRVWPEKTMIYRGQFGRAGEGGESP